MIENSVLVLIVTFNRLNDLKVCISALKNQSYSNINILVINNGSTDGTKEWLSSQNDIITINQQNVGGAGGFYAGMKYMMDHDQYEWLVMMDDDGIADKDEIKNLLDSYGDVKQTYGKDAILNALVVNKDKHDEVSFRWRHGSGVSNKVTELCKMKYIDQIHPFNGTLIPRLIIEKIGLIKREMFIWGDEEEYMARAKHNGYGTYTVTAAVHYHPKEKGQKGNIIPFVPKYTLLVKPPKMSHYFYRNKGFVYSTYPEKRQDRSKYIVANVVYFVTHLKINELFKFIKYFRRGAQNNYE